MPIETAEEMALAKRAELQTKYEAAKERIAMFKHRPEAVNETRLIALVLENAIAALDEVIRAIRAERTPFHAMEKRLAGSVEGGIEAGIALIKVRAYAQGRLDALRGVQAAALYRHAELWLGRMRLTSADERRDIEACELAWAAAQAAEEIETQKGTALYYIGGRAEEAAMTPEDRRERGRR